MQAEQCLRCKCYILVSEVCWCCLGTICFNCWDTFGDCGHCGAKDEHRSLKEEED